MLQNQQGTAPSKRQWPIQWIMLLNIVVVATILSIGSFLLLRNIKKVQIQNHQNISQAMEATHQIQLLVHEQLPLRQLVTDQKLAVDRFVFEFEVFVLEETGEIDQLAKALRQMLANQKKMGNLWPRNLPQDHIQKLRGNVNMAIGIFEEAAEFERVGFGEIYRLAQESETAVDALITVMNEMESVLDQVANVASETVFQNSQSIAKNEERLSVLLRRISRENIFSIGLTLLFVLIFQVYFFMILKSRLVKLSQTANAVMKKGDLSIRVALESNDELGQLSRSFNQMLSSLSHTTISRDFLDNILQSMSDTIIVIEPDTTIIMINTAALNLLGYSEHEITGKHFDQIIERECASSMNERLPDEFYKEFEIKNIEKTYLTKNGNRVPVLFYGSTMRDRHGHVSGLICVAKDVTDMKKMEHDRVKLDAQLQRMEKMEAIGTLAGGVAHDLNNILSGLVSYPDLLLLEIDRDSPIRKPLMTIKRSGEKAAAIVQDLLTLARRGVAVSEVLNLNHVISEYIKSPEFKELKTFNPGVQIQTHLEPNLFNVMGSPIHLSKTIMNLISNAVEATANQGKIIITTKNQYIDRAVRGYDDVVEGEYVVLSVADNGTGISNQDLKRIFEPFYTKKKMGRSGTGLGMAVVWGAVKDHNGYIDIHSVEGERTVFTIYIPVTRKKIAKAELLSLESYMGNGESILIVDDIEEQREIASQMLKQLNYHVETVSSGEGAEEYIKSHVADLIVMDMIMDPGIDGCEAYKRIIRLNPNQRAIIASGFSKSVRVRETLRLGANQYIQKPYSMEALGAAVQKALKK